MFFNTLKKRVNEYFGKKKSNKGNWKMYLKSVLQMFGYFSPFILLLTLHILVVFVLYCIWEGLAA